jgi:ATP-dependent Clp protease ATP-binding subunit ClpC
MLFSEHLFEKLRRRVVGQDLAVREMVRAVVMARAGFSGRGRPLGAFLFLGPTGTGKTTLAAAVAEELYGRPDLLISIDLASVQGIANFVETLGLHIERCGGLVTEEESPEVKARYCQAALDFHGFEELGSELLGVLNHILDSGKIQLGVSERLDFSRAIIFFNGRLCSDRIDELSRSAIGFQGSASVEENDEIDEKIYSVARRCVEAELPAELVGRLDRVIVFKRLRPELLPRVLDYALAEVERDLGRRGYGEVSFSVSERLRETLIAKASRRIYLGARPLVRNVRKYVVFPLADLALSGALAPGGHVELGIEGGRSVARVRAAASIASPPEPVLLPSGAPARRSLS